MAIPTRPTGVRVGRAGSLPPTLVSSAISGPTSVLVGVSVTYRLVGTFSDGSQQVLLADWHSFNPAIGYFTAAGIFLAVAIGTVTIEAQTAMGMTTSSITVMPPTPIPDPPPTPPPPSGTLIQSGNLVYLGAFRLPGGDFPPGSGQVWDYGGWSLAFNPAGNGGLGSLYSVNNNWQAAEFSTPTPVNSPILANLPVAAMLQNFANPIDNWANDTVLVNGSSDGSIVHGGFLLTGGRLHATRYLAYDGTDSQRVSQYTRSLTLATPSFSGFMATQGTWPTNPGGGQEQRYTSGYLALMSAAYASSLRPAISGLGGGNIITSTSNGPAVFGWDPSAVSYPNAIPCQPYVYYDPAHWTIGAWDPNPSAAPGTRALTTGAAYQWAGAATARGAAVPSGFRSCLIFGTGVGTFGYGQGTPTQRLDGQPTGSGDFYIYDPIDQTKGVHGYPYAERCWAYDLNDFLAVKAGTKQPWEVVPYATWPLTLPVALRTRVSVGGVALDVARNRIYVLQQQTDLGGGFNARPLVHGFQVQ